MADLTEDLFFSTIPEWNAKLKSKELSAVDLARAFSTRLEKLGPRYNALALPLSERAIKKAKDIDGDIKRDRFRSQLMGIPFGAKDLLSLAGVPTAWGAKPYAAQVFDDDATALKKLDKAGAVLIGKLSMVQLAGGGGYRYAAASLTGPGINPWDRTCWSGGSSSGAGSAVAAGGREDRPATPGMNALIGAGNLVGYPALSLPCGFAGKLPVAVQLVGLPFSENLLVAIGKQYQSRTDRHRRRPQG